MQDTPKHSWKDFFKLIVRSKLPWHLYFIGLIAMFASTTITLGLPKVMQRIFDGEIFDSALILRYFVLMMMSIVLVAASAFIISITNPVAKRNIQYTIWPKLLRMPMRTYNKQPSQQLISRVTIDPGFIDSAVSEFKSTINSTYGLIGSFVIMYGMNAKLTFALLPVIPYILIVSIVVGHFTQKAQYGVQERFSGLTAFFAERLPKIRLIKAFSKEDFEIERGSEVIQDQYSADKKRAFVDLYAQPLMHSIQALIIGIVLIYGGHLVKKGELTLSEVIAFYMYVQYLHNGILRYGIFWQTVKESKGASEKIANILNSKDEQLERELAFESVRTQSSGDITLENLSFSYGEQNILSNVNFVIPEGKVTAIVGPSGSGKSTIFSIIERLYEPNVGRVLLGTQSAEEIHLNEWRKSIANVSQSTPLLSGSIWDNITYGIDREVTEEEVKEAAEMAAALDFIESFPEGFDTDVGEFGTRLSGGQRQRIAIARAFIMDAQYLLLDEATSNLDARSEHLIINALDTLMANRTTIMISHNLKDVHSADQIIFVDEGTIGGIGTHERLYEENDLYRQLVDIQEVKDARLQLGYEG